MRKLIKNLMVLLMYLTFALAGGVIGVINAVEQYGPYQYPTVLDILKLKILAPHHKFMLIGMLGGIIVMKVIISVFKEIRNHKKGKVGNSNV